MESQFIDYRRLVGQIKELNFVGDSTPCELLLIGKESFPLAVNSKGQILAAAGFYGKGRVVVLSHESYLQNAGWANFLSNILDWLSASSGNSVVGVHQTLDLLYKRLSNNNTFPEKIIISKDWQKRMTVYCMPAYYNDHQANKLIKFIKYGGGLLVGGQAWSVEGLEDVLSEFPGNKVTSIAGIYFTANTAVAELVRIPKSIPFFNLTVPSAMDFSRDVRQLLEQTLHYDISYEALPSSLLVHGSLAFPVILGQELQVVVAAACYGRGRVVVVSHENQMWHTNQRTFVQNALKWLSWGKSSMKVAIHPNLGDETELTDFLSRTSSSFTATEELSSIDVFICTTYEISDPNQLRDFVAAGGGLLIGGQAWGSDSAALGVLEYNLGNQLLNQFGISLLSDCLENKVYETKPIPSYHFRQILQEAFQSQNLNSVPELFRKKFSYDASQLLRAKTCNVPHFDCMYQILCDLLSKETLPEPCKDCPAKTSLELMVHYMSAFAPCSRARVTIDGTNSSDTECWRSTGLYADPKTAIYFTLPYFLQDLDWHIQIGSHTDDLLTAAELWRPPVVAQRFPITEDRFALSSKFGGLLYVIVPAQSNAGVIDITIEEATKAPYFKSGETNVADWESRIRHYPAPWAEIETENIILTVPSSAARSILNPEPLVELWDRMMRAVAKLAALPNGFPRPERIVADVQLSFGWMHSGYPVMAHLESVDEMVNVDYIRSKSVWGLIHELGHNQQVAKWEFPPHTEEATCNLWAVYVHEEVLGIPKSQAHEELEPKAREDRINNYIEKGAKLEDWEVFTCLETYLQLQERFGWEPFIEVFSHYHAVTFDTEDNEFKMNYWARQFSNTVSHNLGPFFVSWGWPLRDEVLKELKLLPDWTDNPMLKYPTTKKSS